VISSTSSEGGARSSFGELGDAGGADSGARGLDVPKGAGGNVRLITVDHSGGEVGIIVKPSSTNCIVECEVRARRTERSVGEDNHWLAGQAVLEEENAKCWRR
jgi:hypothetical protein